METIPLMTMTVLDRALVAGDAGRVTGRASAIHELRRVLAAGGACVAVTNGPQHLRALRELVGRAGSKGTPGWQMHSPAAGALSADNAAAQLRAAFRAVTCVRPSSAAPVVIHDAAVAADDVSSMGDHYQDEITRPWHDVVQDVRQWVQAVINDKGAFTTSGDLAAFVCR
jgi:hypothetical protein